MLVFFSRSLFSAGFFPIIHKFYFDNPSSTNVKTFMIFCDETYKCVFALYFFFMNFFLVIFFLGMMRKWHTCRASFFSYSISKGATCWFVVCTRVLFFFLFQISYFSKSRPFSLLLLYMFRGRISQLCYMMAFLTATTTSSQSGFLHSGILEILKKKNVNWLPCVLWEFLSCFLSKSDAE